jgi:DNA-directed RNA polymerase subunit RPC12/RpoP
MQSLPEFPQAVKSLSQLPEGARRLLTLDREANKPLYPGAVIEARSDDTFIVRRRSRSKLVVYRCTTCGQWISVLAHEPPTECNACKMWRRYRRRHPITSSAAKERPRCRRAIIERGLTPWPAVDAWDGVSAKTPDGQHVSLSDGMRKELRKMIVEVTSTDSRDSARPQGTASGQDYS